MTCCLPRLQVRLGPGGARGARLWQALFIAAHGWREVGERKAKMFEQYKVPKGWELSVRLR